MYIMERPSAVDCIIDKLKELIGRMKTLYLAGTNEQIVFLQENYFGIKPLFEILREADQGGDDGAGILKQLCEIRDAQFPPGRAGSTFGTF